MLSASESCLTRGGQKGLGIGGGGGNGDPLRWTLTNMEIVLEISSSFFCFLPYITIVIRSKFKCAPEVVLHK